MSPNVQFFGLPNKPEKDLKANFFPGAVTSGQKPSKLHDYTAAPVANGNRAERRQYKKQQKRKK